MNLLDGPVELLDCDEVLQVKRQGRVVDSDVAYLDGLPVALHVPLTFEVAGTVQPMGGKDLLLVPEVFRDKETLWLWASHPDPDSLDPVIDVTDIVTHKNKLYQVQTCEDWGSYSRCMLVAMDIGLPSEDPQGPIYPEPI